MALNIHYLPFKANASAQYLNVRVGVEFAIVAGANAYGGSLLQPTLCPARHMVPGGYDGLPYKYELGQAGLLVPVDFSSIVGGLHIATYTDALPNLIIESRLIMSGLSAVVGSGNSITRVLVGLGGSNSVTLNCPPSPLSVLQVDFPAGKLYTGPPAGFGYTVFSSNILPLI